MATSNFRRASPAAVVIFTATVDPVTAEEVCGRMAVNLSSRRAS